MDPRRHYDDIVEPNLKEFHDNFASLRHAFNVAAAADALAAHIYWWCVENNPGEVAGITSDTGYREKLAKADSSFALLRDVAKAHKHVKLTRSNPMVSSSEQSTAMSVGYGVRGYSEGRFIGVTQIFIVTESGEALYFENIIRNATRFLCAQMERVGVPTRS
jgi:hypothetical protein